MRETFTASLSSRWKRYIKGGGSLDLTGSTLRFAVAGASRGQYSDAQLDDYQGLARRRFPWRPPLRMEVRARFSHPEADQVSVDTPHLVGTAGFGFWNDPFLMTGARWPALPRAAWFFYSSPPSNMKLDLNTPGPGWKAATIDALRPGALLLAPLALPALLLMNSQSLYRVLWPPIQRALNIAEARVPVAMTGWHTYTLEWDVKQTRFFVDARGESAAPLLEAPSPRGPLGFVIWLDNQYLVATPQGRFRWGLLDAAGPQWMEVDHLTIEAL